MAYTTRTKGKNIFSQVLPVLKIMNNAKSRSIKTITRIQDNRLFQPVSIAADKVLLTWHTRKRHDKIDP